MRKIGFVVLVVLALLCYLTCPIDLESKARFIPVAPEREYTPVIRRACEDCDIFPVARGEGGELASVSGRYNSGNKITIDLSGKTFVSARVRFTGVSTEKSEWEYQSSPRSTRSGSAAAGSSAVPSIIVPSTPIGYSYYRTEISGSLTSTGYGAWWINATGVSGNSGNGTYGSMSGTSSQSSGAINFTIGHDKGCNWQAEVYVTGRKSVTNTYHTQSPSCGGSYSGTLANGSSSGWISFSLQSNKSNSLTVSVSGSGVVDIEIEYTYTTNKLPQSAPSAPSASSITTSSAVLSSDSGSQIVCNGQTKSSGSTWSGLSEDTQYSAYAYMPETSTHDRSPNSSSTSFRTASSKQPQPAPSAPSVDSIGPYSVTLSSDSGSQIVCNGSTKASGSTWTGLSEDTQYSAYAYMPETSTKLRSPNSSTTTFWTPAATGPPSVTTLQPQEVSYASATIRGQVTSANGATPTKYLRWGLSPETMDETYNGGEGTGAYSFKLTDLLPGTAYYYQAYATNVYGTREGAVVSFKTSYPILPAPEKILPEAGTKTTDRQPWLSFILRSNPHNTATKYHAQVRVAEGVSMGGAVLDSSTNVTRKTAPLAGPTAEWQYRDGEQWKPYPSEGVDPDTEVRVRPTFALGFKTYYWDCAAFDGQVWGTNATPTSFRVMVVVVDNYYLDIEGVEQMLYSLEVSEASNGEIGFVNFSVDNEPDPGTGKRANEVISYGDLVTLGVNDGLGNTDEFRGIVRHKSPQGDILGVSAILGDGILAERRCKEDYPSQDIGLSVRTMIQNYCQPLTADSVDTATGFVAPIVAKDQTPLRVLEDLRRRYSVFYFVDKDWDLHFYKPSAIQSALAQIQYGNNGVSTC